MHFYQIQVLVEFQCPIFNEVCSNLYQPSAEHPAGAMVTLRFHIYLSACLYVGLSQLIVHARVRHFESIATVTVASFPDLEMRDRGT